jgi:hypothetical protein
MPTKLEGFSVALAGADAVATAAVVVTDDKGVEISRKTVTAQVNAALRATDADRRGLKIDARDRLKALVLEQVAEAEGEATKVAEPLEHFAGLGDEIAAVVAKGVPVVVGDEKVVGEVVR